MEGRKPKYPECPGKGKNRQQIQPTYETGPESNPVHIGGRRGGERSHHCASPVHPKGSSLRWSPCASVLYITVILRCKLVCYIWSSASRRLDILQSTVCKRSNWCRIFSWQFQVLSHFVSSYMILSALPSSTSLGRCLES